MKKISILLGAVLLFSFTACDDLLEDAKDKVDDALYDTYTEEEVQEMSDDIDDSSTIEDDDTSDIEDGIHALVVDVNDDNKGADYSFDELQDVTTATKTTLIKGASKVPKQRMLAILFQENATGMLEFLTDMSVDDVDGEVAEGKAALSLGDIKLELPATARRGNVYIIENSDTEVIGRFQFEDTDGRLVTEGTFKLEK